MDWLQTANIPNTRKAPLKKAPRAAAQSRKPADVDSMRFAYVMSRFPKISETFVLYEILALMESGIQVEVFPLIRERQPVSHADVAQVMPHVHYLPIFSVSIALANLFYLFTKPLRYAALLVEVLIGCIRSPRFFTKSALLFPKIVRFAYEMNKLGVQHIHAHFATHPAFAGYVVNKLTGIPYSFTAHGSDIHNHRHVYGLERKVRAADFVRTISNYNKAYIREICGEQHDDKIKVIHCGIDRRVFVSPLAERDADGPFTLICVASYEEVKGHSYLVEACRKLKSAGVSFRCHLVGDGPIRETIERKIANEELSEEFLIHGPLPRKRVVELLQQSDVSVLFSCQTRSGSREGIPVALMEAMAVALPVVSTWLSGIPELVEHERSGILVRQRDVDGLFQALLQLQRDPALRESMGRAGRDKVFREFDLEQNSAELLDLLVRSIATERAPELA